MRMRSIYLVNLGLVLLLAGRAAAQSADPPATEPAETPELRRGAIQETFTERDPRSPIEAQNQRYHVPTDGLQRYELSEHGFEIYVPQDYDPQQTYGILSWISASDRGGMPRGWREVMDKQHLIFIGADDSGNEKGIAVRFGLAMDGVHNLRARYNIDDSRVYAAGNSGGGKIASMLFVLYPEVFRGAVPIVGITYFRAITLRDDPKRGWLPSYSAPPTPTLNRAKELSRIVMITGTNDMNRDSIRDAYERGFLVDGFKFVDYIEVDGMGHTTPPAQYIDQAIAFLDKPLPDLCQRMLEVGQQLQRSSKREEAQSLYHAVILHGDPRLAGQAQELLDRLSPVLDAPTKSLSPATPLPATRPASPGLSRAAQADSILSLAENYERNQLYTQAKQRAQQIVRDFADTPAAEKAKGMIRRIDSRR